MALSMICLSKGQRFNFSRCLKKVGTSQHIESSEDEENVFNQGRISVDFDEGTKLVDNQEKDAQVKGRQANTQAEIYNIDLDHTSKVLKDEENVFNQGRISVDFDEGTKLVDDQEKDAQVKGRQANTQAEIYNIDLDHTSKVVAVSIPIPATKPAAKPKALKIAVVALVVSIRKRKGVVIRDPEEELHDDTLAETQSAKDKGKGIFVEDPKPMKKKDQIEMDAEYARKLQEEEESHVQAKDVQPKGIQYIKRYHRYKKKPQTESEACKNMIDYLKNTKGFKMAFFKGKTYDQILKIFQPRFDANMRFLLKSREEMEKEEEEIIKSINETPVQKAEKIRRLCEQAKEDENLKKWLEVVVDEDDDVFIEAIQLAKRSLLEDLEDLWKIVKARFFTSKPTNFSDDYLLATLKNMFEKTDAQDVTWRSQQTEHGHSSRLKEVCGLELFTVERSLWTR
nr:hypothetical protein [Tanacetum cinerariifolium]